MNENVRWGIIGCGDVVERKSGPSFRDVPHSELIGVMRRSLNLAEDFAKRYNVPIWTNDANKIIHEPRIDAIYIATPPSHHLEYGLKVCAAGKPCLIEKPGGRSSEEWNQLVEAFRKAGVPLFLSFYRRFLPKHMQVKEILESGVLGSITSIQYQYVSPGMNNNWRIDPGKSGGGLFWDIGCHVLDLFEFWFGPLELIGGTAANSTDSYPVEDVVNICFRTKDGILGTGLWDFTARVHDEQFTVHGTGGKLMFQALDPWSPVTLKHTLLKF